MDPISIVSIVTTAIGFLEKIGEWIVAAIAAHKAKPQALLEGAPMDPSTIVDIVLKFMPVLEHLIDSFLAIFHKAPPTPASLALGHGDMIQKGVAVAKGVIAAIREVEILLPADAAAKVEGIVAVVTKFLTALEEIEVIFLPVPAPSLAESEKHA